ncbi:hypothetical protein ACR2RM_06835 [Pseudomonas aeruginosa]|uniref:hypothetical protein n=1 Tax=Pseudomonas aeruginosa TaxID=287 RepID=UPI003F2F2BE0
MPVADLARIAMREGVRPRATYQSHKWFARRFAVTARALLVGAACNTSDSFWRTFYKGDSWIGRTVLDPFVGGGVMLLEATRLGAAVHGVDVEPVAAAISRFQTTLRDLPDLDIALQELIDSVGIELAPYYRAQDADGRDETLLHAFWVQRVQCGACEHTFDAHPSFKLAWSEPDHRQWVVCHNCSQILEADINTSNVICGCGAETPTNGGLIERGRVCCPRCRHSEPLIEYARRTASSPDFRLFAVETLPVGDIRRLNVRDRRLRASTAFDLARYRDAEARLESLLSERPNSLPEGQIPLVGRNDNRLVDYGYRDYIELFNARQRLHLALLGNAINKIKGNARSGLAIAFSDHLTTNNMLCAYAGGWRRLTPLFSIRAYRHIARPVEINPWLQRNGRGTFPNAVRAVTRASEALRSPREPSPRGLLKKIKDARPGAANIICGDARRLKHIPSNSVDMVLTDPPYFDYISYSELGHFFTPWFRRFRLINPRGARHFPKAQIASGARTAEAERRFARRLGDAFKEMHRVSKPQGRVVFTYQNLDGRGWQAISTAMAKAGVIPICTIPLYGDSSASLHKYEHSISWDAVMVCRLGEPCPRLKIGENDLLEGRRVAEEWCQKLSAKGLKMTAGDRVNIAHASSIVAAFERSLTNDSKHAAA